MTRRKPLVLVDGVPTQLPEGDSLVGGGGLVDSSLIVLTRALTLVHVPLVQTSAGTGLKVLAADDQEVIVEINHG